MTGNAHERGWEKLRQLDGEGVIEGLAGVDPDLGRYALEFGFGELYSRRGLDLSSPSLERARRDGAANGCCWARGLCAGAGEILSKGGSPPPSPLFGRCSSARLDGMFLARANAVDLILESRRRRT